MTPVTVILRHKKENLKKCSLEPLVGRSDLLFCSYPFKELPPLKGYLMLAMSGTPLLSLEDRDKGILLLDSTWRYLPKMCEAVDRAVTLEKRVLPGHFRTAYPRTQTDCEDPERGLSSLEALYVVNHILGRSNEGVLDHYYWKEEFLAKNKLTYK